MRLADFEQRARGVAGLERQKQQFVRARAQNLPHQAGRLFAHQREQHGPRRTFGLLLEVVQRRVFVAVEHHHRDVGRGGAIAVLGADLRRHGDDFKGRIAEILERGLDLGAPPLVFSDQQNPERTLPPFILSA